MLDYEKRDLLISKVVALKELSQDVLEMLKELDTDEDNKISKNEVKVALDDLVEELPEEETENSVEETEEVQAEEEGETEEVEFSADLIWETFTKTGLLEILKDEFGIQLPKNSRKTKIIELLNSLIVEKGEDYVYNVFFGSNEEAPEETEETVEERCYIDDDGVEHVDKEPFFVNGELYCCGSKCQDTEDGVMVCQHCGVNYSFE